MTVISVRFGTEDIFADNFKQRRCGSSLYVSPDIANLNNKSNNQEAVTIIKTLCKKSQKVTSSDYYFFAKLQGMLKIQITFSKNFIDAFHGLI